MNNYRGQFTSWEGRQRAKDPLSKGIEPHMHQQQAIRTWLATANMPSAAGIGRSSQLVARTQADQFAAFECTLPRLRCPHGCDSFRVQQLHAAWQDVYDDGQLP